MKKSIPKSLKAMVWDRWIGEDIGTALCYCCRHMKIRQDSFHCGHVISEVNGGTLEIDNLRPICALCNGSMGTMNLEEFAHTYHPKKITNNNPNDLLKNKILELKSLNTNILYDEIRFNYVCGEYVSIEEKINQYYGFIILVSKQYIFPDNRVLDAIKINLDDFISFKNQLKQTDFFSQIEWTSYEHYEKELFSQ
ncbi:HNH endonuclease [Klosneuvirus KNV1]|uniref:HNH endonuclease n=1 Tax=Klosneuvirus KNV1 TaxID=1977640 RepID=A0A1V0SLJ4_9VIRU|nr:HNH endonuclease [Klosneuvirus KNV1]